METDTLLPTADSCVRHINTSAQQLNNNEIRRKGGRGGDVDKEETVCELPSASTAANTSLMGSEIRPVIITSLPFALTFSSSFSIPFVIQIFAKKFTVAQSGGYGLAAMLVNSVGFATISGLSGGLDTVLSQAYGADPKHRMITVNIQRAVVVFSCMCVPLGALLLTAGYWMKSLGASASEETVDAAAELLRILVLVLPLWSLSEILQTYLAAIGATTEIFVGCFFAALLNPLLLYTMLPPIGFGGLAVSWVLCVLIMFAGSFLWGAATKKIFEAWTVWEWKNIDRKGCWQFLKLAIPAWFMMLCEWTGYEMNIVLSARVLNTERFTAIVVCYQCMTIMVPLNVAVGYAMTMRIGNFVGAEDIEGAKRAAKAGALIVFVIVCVDIAILIGLREDFPRIFTSSEEVRSTVASAFPYVAIFHVVDVYVSYLGGIFRGIGHQTQGAVFTAVGWWVLGIPMGWVLYAAKSIYEPLDLGVFFVGPAIGLFVATIAMCVYLLKVKWSQPAEVADALASRESHHQQVDVTSADSTG